MSRPSVRSLVATCIALFLTLVRGHCEVALPKIFGDNMVLQRNVPVPVWGTAGPGEDVSATFAGQTQKAKADTDGKWQLKLKPLTASAKEQDLVISGTGNTVTLHGVLVGEVWLCSGQSNMEMAVSIGARAGSPIASQTDAQLAADVKGPPIDGIRLFRVEKVIQPPDVVTDGWTACGGDALGKFSVLGYLVARQLHDQLHVPIGMIESSWGGTRIEVWTPPKGYTQLMAFAKETAAATGTSGGVLTMDGTVPGRNYDAMVRPLQPLAVRGVLWYQGESNVIECNDGLRYADKMEALIDSWRAAWKQPALPFIDVQVAPYAYTQRKDKLPHTVTNLAELWEAQERALSIPNTWMAPTSDLVDDLRQIHPQQKRPLAARLAMIALAKVYGLDEPATAAPSFGSAVIRGAKVLIHFREVGQGLKSHDAQGLNWFEIAGADGNYVPAAAKIVGPDEVEVWNTQVPLPKVVRFAWNEGAEPNLANSEGWPALPFRTDGPAWSPQQKTQ
jgi:sialate O-acetylesterase